MSGKKFAPKRARTGFELLEKRTGASPSCLRVSHEPLPLIVPFGFADCEANAAAFRRARRERLSSSDKSESTRVRVLCKGISEKSVGHDSTCPVNSWPERLFKIPAGAPKPSLPGVRGTQPRTIQRLWNLCPTCQRLMAARSSQGDITGSLVTLNSTSLICPNT